ncbi:MAG: phosphoglucosamine mutase [Planctomycetota bacterium]|jgi:phosphoglucosamine mutase
MTLFGTDGIRSRAGEGPLAPDSVRRLGQVLGYLVKSNSKAFRAPVPDWFSKKHPASKTNVLGKGRVLIGRDTRASGPEIEETLAKGFRDFGVECILAGVIPTPGAAFLTRRWSCPLGIVISASHNPAHDNGIKVLSNEGLKIPDATEHEVEKLFESSEFSPNIKHSGTRRVAKPRDVSDRVEPYLASLREALDGDVSLEGMSVVIDCANGAASELAPRVLNDLGVQVTVIHNTPDGENINRECGATRPSVVAAQAAKSGADLGAALDGDADRAILADAQGRIVDGDHLLAMHALDLRARSALPGDTIVGTLMTNHALVNFFSDRHLHLIRVKVGDRFIMEELFRGGYRLGGEPSGHLIFLDAAPAGDGMLTMLMTLSLMKRSGRTLAELASDLQKYPQILINVPVREKPSLDNVGPVQKARRDAEDALSGKGRVVLRYSGTEPLCRVMVEGPDETQVRSLAERIAKTVRSSIGKSPTRTPSA